MERIENVLQRIQELYFDKRQKTSIDLDLMLDYTRVMYADLLEWKKNVRQDEIGQDHEKSETEDKANTLLQPETAHHIPAESEARPTEEALSAIEDSKSEVGGQDMEASGGKEIDWKPEDAGNQEDDQEPEPEKTSVDSPVAEEGTTREAGEKEHFIIRDRSVLSYEPPKVSAKSNDMPEKTVKIQDGPEQETEQEKTHRPTSPEIPFFTESFTSPALKNKDIRKNIGLNDKYLFLNELFNNQRPAYDEALDKITSLPTLEAAQQYLNEEILEKYKWDKNDETVKDFYTVLGKYFSTK